MNGGEKKKSVWTKKHVKLALHQTGTSKIKKIKHPHYTCAE